MNKRSSQNRKRLERTVALTKKQMIGIAIGVGVVLAIAAIAYFAWPKPVPITELTTEDLVVGTGREAQKGDTVVMEYIGWVATKSKADPFDESRLHDTPFEFVLGQGEVIEGWERGIPGMKVGGKRKLTIPSDMGYGAAGGANGKIPPNAALIFEVELLDVIGSSPDALPPTSVTELKIEDLAIGNGAEAKAGDTLRIHYTGWLEDGTKFDSSHDSGQPIEFVLGQGEVIKGWDQGIVGMKVGGKRKLTIPPNLAYGAEGAPGFIPPNAALIFEVELLEIK